MGNVVDFGYFRPPSFSPVNLFHLLFLKTGKISGIHLTRPF